MELDTSKSKRKNWKVEIFYSHNEAFEAEKRDYWAMTPIQRLQLTEYLRSLMYENPAPRLQRVFEVLERQ